MVQVGLPVLRVKWQGGNSFDEPDEHGVTDGEKFQFLDEKEQENVYNAIRENEGLLNRFFKRVLLCIGIFMFGFQMTFAVLQFYKPWAHHYSYFRHISHPMVIVGVECVSALTFLVIGYNVWVSPDDYAEDVGTAANDHDDDQAEGSSEKEKEKEKENVPLTPAVASEGEPWGEVAAPVGIVFTIVVWGVMWYKYWFKYFQVSFWPIAFFTFGNLAFYIVTHVCQNWMYQSGSDIYKLRSYMYKHKKL